MEDNEKTKIIVGHEGSIFMSKAKVNAKERLKAAKACIDGRKTVNDIIKKYGVERSTVYWWINQYRSEGADAFVDNRENNRKYSDELKEQAVRDYLDGKGSQSSICIKYKIRSKHQLRDWIKIYNSNGNLGKVKHSGGGSYMKEGRNTTHEERIRIAKECLECVKNYGEIALKYNVSYQQVRTWTQRYEKLGEAWLEDRRGRRKRNQTPRTELEAAQIEIEQLKRKLYIAEMECDLLKKLEEVERRNASHK